MTDPKSIDHRLNFFQRCLKDRARTVYGEVFAACKDKMLSGFNLEKEASEYSDSDFFEFIKRDEVLTDEDKKGKSRRGITRTEANLASGAIFTPP